MARVNVYIPDELASAAREAGLKVSLITQQALRATLAAQSTDEWLGSLPDDSHSLVRHERIIATLDSIRDEGTTRHG